MGTPTGDAARPGASPTAAGPAAPKPFAPPEPVVTAATLKPGHVLCLDCDGLGWCPECLARGYLLDDRGDRRRCFVCFGSKICQICDAFGQKSLADMPSWVRRQYPAAPTDPR
ncbi:hypothetical protein [Micromonospora sp. NPDC047074]|uniref:hypothetical protein n=1 Tax=Micromonospora sp. NPDC047074 TaxID=3154339 RepID=UPI0033FBDB4D